MGEAGCISTKGRIRPVNPAFVMREAPVRMLRTVCEAN
jgi:hypothetical protein